MQKEKVKVNEKTRKERKVKYLLYAIGLFIANLMTNVSTAYASINWGKNAKDWLSGQAVEIGLCVIIIALIYCLLKKSYVAAAVSVIGGGVILFLIANPDKIKTAGEAIGNIIMK